MVTRIDFKVLKLHSPAARAILRTLKTALEHIYHEMHERSCDFLYSLNIQSCYSFVPVSPRGFGYPKDGEGINENIKIKNKYM